jgi:VWFA-related protein
MRRLALAVCLASAATFGSVRADQQTTPQAGDPQFRGGVNVVPIYATVVDETGRLVPDLKKEDFVILDNGRPREVSDFSNAPQPITVVLMLDRSVSLQAKFDLERSAAEAFVANLIPGDRARIGSFNSMIRIDPVGFTGDRDELIRILHFDLLDAGLTPLWNAASSAMNALVSQQGRRVVLLISDGHNNPGMPERKTVTFEDVRDRAIAEDVAIYAVGLSNPCGGSIGGGPALDQRAGGPPAPPGGGPDGGGTTPTAPPRPINGPHGTVGGPANPGPGINMEDLFSGRLLREAPCTGAEPAPDLADIVVEGGGGYLAIRDGDDLGTKFARLADELHHQYLIGFRVEALDGHPHTIEVRTRNPKQHVRARTTYLAVKK